MRKLLIFVASGSCGIILYTLVLYLALGGYKDVYFDLGLRAVRHHCLEKAAEYFHKALIRDRRLRDAYVGLGHIHFKWGNYKEAMDYFYKAALVGKKDKVFLYNMKELILECIRRHEPQ